LTEQDRPDLVAGRAAMDRPGPESIDHTGHQISLAAARDHDAQRGALGRWPRRPYVVGREGDPAIRQRDRPGRQVPVGPQRDVYRPLLTSGRVPARAIERVDDPDPIRTEPLETVRGL